MTPILIVGADGQLGSALRELDWPEMAVSALGREQLNLCDSQAIENAIQRLQPSIVINAAAYTAVDKAEVERESSRAINVSAVKDLAMAAEQVGAWFIHFSSDYVYDGSGSHPWREKDVCLPINAYGRDKREGEELAIVNAVKTLIFRTSWVYSADRPCFLGSMLRLACERDALSIVDDQWGAPTYNKDLAKSVQEVVIQLLAEPDSVSAAGIYNICGGGETTWYRFCEAILGRAAKHTKFSQRLRVRAESVKAIRTEEYPLPAKRPLNSRLDQNKLELQFGVKLPEWEGALDRCFREI